jgi:Sigma-70, region 4
VQVEQKAELHAVLAGLQKLWEIDRAALLMRAFDEMPYEEIAQALGIAFRRQSEDTSRAARAYSQCLRLKVVGCERFGGNRYERHARNHSGSVAGVSFGRGEASPATCSLVEEYMKQDPELAQRIRLQWTENIAEVAPSALPPDLELRSLSRTRGLLGLQRWLSGFEIFFIAFSLSNEFSFADGRLKEFHFLLRDYPIESGIA